jgi:O-antigen/teichoic acid export membrane protein
MEITRAAIMPLFRLGGWMTASNIVGPLMLYMDRFVIGGLISAAAVAYYATPYEVVTKLLIISGAISAVMFPAFGASFARDLSRTVDLYRRGMKCTVAIMLPLILLLALIAKEGLTLWLGPEFADHSLHVAQFLLVGTLAFGIETLPFALIQGAGRPDIPAKLNLIEIPFYAATLYWFIERYGVTGAAAAWALRAVVDALLLLVFAQRLLRVPACADPEKSLCPLTLNSNPG